MQGMAGGYLYSLVYERAKDANNRTSVIRECTDFATASILLLRNLDSHSLRLSGRLSVTITGFSSGGRFTPASLFADTIFAQFISDCGMRQT